MSAAPKEEQQEAPAVEAAEAVAAIDVEGGAEEPSLLDGYIALGLDFWNESVVPLAYEWAAPLLPSNTTVEKGYTDGLVDVATSVATVPAGTTCVGIQAFAGNADVQEVVLRPSVTSIAAEAFHNCSSLRKVTFEGKVFINGRAFLGCTALEEVVMQPRGVTAVGAAAFENCTALKSITIPDGTCDIGKQAFQGCSSLVSVTIGSGVNTVGYEAFRNCAALTCIVLPAGIVSISQSCFENCSALQTVTLPETCTQIDSRCFANCVSLQRIVLPPVIEDVSEGSFYMCSSLQSVEIPVGAASIGPSAFEGCSSLQRITVPATVSRICVSAFERCAALKTVTYTAAEGWKGPASNGQGTIALEKDAFALCTSLVELPVPATCECIGPGVFSSCSSAVSITVPDCMQSIGDRVFQNCRSLQAIAVPAHTTVGKHAFEGCLGTREAHYEQLLGLPEFVGVTFVAVPCVVEEEEGGGGSLAAGGLVAADDTDADVAEVGIQMQDAAVPQTVTD